MPTSRRFFLQQLAALGALPPLVNEATRQPAEPLPGTEKNGGAQQLDKKYAEDVQLYIAKDSAELARNISAWTHDHQAQDIEQTTWRHYSYQWRKNQLARAEAQLKQKENLVAYLREHRPTDLGEPVMSAQTRAGAHEYNQSLQSAMDELEYAEREQQSASSELKAAEKRLQEVAHIRLSPAPIPREELPLQDAKLLPTGQETLPGEKVDIALCRLFTSNRGHGNNRPWNDYDKGELEDRGLLGFTVEYTVPAHPCGCYAEKKDHATILYDFQTADRQRADGIPYQRVFEGVPISVNGELTLHCQLIDLADKNDRSFWQKATSFVIRVWRQYQGLSLADPLGLGAAPIISNTAERLQGYAEANRRNKLIWDYTLKSGRGVIFSRDKEHRAGTYVLSEGLYVMVDSSAGDLATQEYLVNPSTFQVHRGIDELDSNYLVFEISRSKSPA